MTSQLRICISTMCFLISGIAHAASPNIVFVISDDQGYGDLGCTGNPVIKTPNIDQLASESSGLSDYHVAPTCSPTRCSLLTGHWTNRTGVWHTIMGRSMLREDEVTVGQMFADAGYETGMFGKWHLGDNYPYRPEDRGFTEVFRHGGGGIGQTPDIWDNAYFDGSYFHNGEIVPAKGFCTDVFFEKANSFITKCAKEQKPFLAYVSTNAPHKPLHCPPNYYEMYEGQSDSIAAFYGMITNIDDNLGKTRKLIQELGVADNTIFVFTTDNGTASGAKVFNAGMRAGKGSPYEGGHRVPFFLHWPAGGITKQHDVKTLTHAVDIVPTLLEMTGVTKPDEVNFDGVSIADLLDPTKDVDWPERFVISDSQRVRDPIKWRSSSVMSQKYRLINGKELYEIGVDPGQSNNIAEDHPDVVTKMREFYEEWWADLEPSFAQTTEIYLGHPEHPVVSLTAHDWIQEVYPPWHQGSIRDADRKHPKSEKLVHKGHWAVKVIEDGKYQISLRRWPAESGVAINAPLPAGEGVPGASDAFRSVVGNAINASHGVLRIDGKDLDRKSVGKDAEEVSFVTNLKKGSYQLAPVFEIPEGELGAYYVIVTRLTSDQANLESIQERDDRLAWWREAKFGMFVHWGVYSVVGGEYKGQKLPNSAEWMMCRGKVPIAEYEKYAEQFNPTEFDADKFVGLAKKAGMKYLVITAKHHDGFAMFDSKASDYNVVDKSPFNRDIMKELADACAKQGIKFGFYYSQAQDWHHPGGFGNNWDKTIKRVSSDDYVFQKAAPEVEQLMTEYGPLGIFWWDTPRDMTEEAFNKLHSLTKLQSNVITNDRLGDDFKGDYKTFERHIPAEAPAEKDWEVCMPISGSWGYKKGDDNFKSVNKLITNLVDIASKGGNYLLNVSPTGNGTLLPQATERLEAIGQWMETNSESIYGTSASPLGKFEWGRCTARSTKEETTLYLHVFDWPESGELLVPGLAGAVKQATLLADGQSLETRSSGSGLTIALPSSAADENVSVIKLTVPGELKFQKVLPTPDKTGSLVLTADKTFIHNNEGSKDAGLRFHDDIPHVGYWLDDQAWLEWEINIDQPGTYEIYGTMSVDEAVTRFSVGPTGSQVDASVASTGGYGNYAESKLGEISFEKAGITSVQVKPTVGKWQPMNLRQLRLQRSETN